MESGIPGEECPMSLPFPSLVMQVFNVQGLRLTLLSLRPGAGQ